MHCKGTRMAERTDTSSAATHDVPRRGFLARAGTAALGLLLVAAPLAAGLWTFLDPLRRKGRAGRLVRVAPLDAVPTDGTPRRFTLVDDLSDAWTRYPRQPLGAVYLLRNSEEDPPTALSETCPHAGCSVGYDAADQLFQCPCHQSAFTKTGERIPPSPSPRDLYSLEVDPEKLAAGEVWVRLVDA
jgi:menaquinol-cytochrome c reductase iron-sulfur subunit